MTNETTTLTPLRVLFLSDTYPGHHNFADGVLLAIKKQRPVDCTVIRARAAPNIRMRLVRPLTRKGPAALKATLIMGYGINAWNLPDVDLVLSGGGETLAANVAAARLLNVPNIFCGTLRGGMTPEQFSLVINSYEGNITGDNHIATLKPGIFDPSVFERSGPYVPFSRDRPPGLMGLLVGGKSGFFRYERSEWQDLIDRISRISDATGIKWIISTSRRTPDYAADMFVDLSKSTSVVDQLIDFRNAGPGTLFDLFNRSDAAIAMADSSAMLSESIAAGLPTISVYPKTSGFKRPERLYREQLVANNWCRDVALSDLDSDILLDKLSEIEIVTENQISIISKSISEKLPDLFPSDEGSLVDL